MNNSHEGVPQGSENLGKEGRSVEHETEVREFLSGLLQREIGKLEAHKAELQSERAGNMSEAARAAQIEGCDREINLIHEASKLFKLEEL